jgi:hypothetical protein
MAYSNASFLSPRSLNCSARCCRCFPFQPTVILTNYSSGLSMQPDDMQAVLLQRALGVLAAEVDEAKWQTGEGGTSKIEHWIVKGANSTRSNVMTRMSVSQSSDVRRSERHETV